MCYCCKSFGEVSNLQNVRHNFKIARAQSANPWATPDPKPKPDLILILAKLHSASLAKLHKMCTKLASAVFNLPHHTWSLHNSLRTSQGPCCANLHKWGLAQSPSCDHGQRQTMNHIVDTCPLTQFEGRLKLLQEAVTINSDHSTREMKWISQLSTEWLYLHGGVSSCEWFTVDWYGHRQWTAWTLQWWRLWTGRCCRCRRRRQSCCRHCRTFHRQTPVMSV